VLGVGLLAGLFLSIDGRIDAGSSNLTASKSGTKHSSGHSAAAHNIRPGRVRLVLEELLGHHSILAVRMMRALVGDSPDLAQTLKDSLSTNTSDLVGVVKSAHGLDAARRFKELWTEHNLALIRYAEALAANDDSAEQANEERLDEYRKQFGSFMESATKNKVKAGPVAHALKTHISQLTRQVHAYADGDYAAAYRLERAAFEHMFPTGKVLAGGLLAHSPGEFVVHISNPGQDLRSTLGQLLGEHVELVVDTTRAGLAGPRGEFRQAAGSLNENTKDVSKAMDALFGKKKTKKFVDIWSDHIDLFVDYTAAAAAGNQSGMDKARDDLQGFQHRLGAFLVKATHDKKGIAAASHELSMHDDLLLRQIDAYAAEDYAAAHNASNKAYKGMFSVASKLGSVIQAQSKKSAPKGGAQTGGGGTA
jgi:hypothetical protein